MFVVQMKFYYVIVYLLASGSLLNILICHLSGLFPGNIYKISAWISPLKFSKKS